MEFGNARIFWKSQGPSVSEDYYDISREGDPFRILIRPSQWGYGPVTLSDANAVIRELHYSYNGILTPIE